MKKTVIFLLILFVGTPFASAAVLDVVAGYDPADSNFSAYNSSTTYANLQEAWGNTVNGDEIAIHGGVYEKVHVRDANYYSPGYDQNSIGDLSSCVLDTSVDGNRVQINDETPGYPEIMDRSNIWIHPAGDGKVTLKGELKIYGTLSGGTYDITIEGLYLDTSYPAPETSFHRAGAYFKVGNGKSLGLVTLRDLVVYNGTHDYNSSYADQGVQFRDGGDHGPYVINHCTFVVLSGAIGNLDHDSYGIYDKQADHDVLGDPNLKSNIIINFREGTFTSWGPRNLFGNSCVYGITETTELDFQAVDYAGPSSVSMDPHFVSTDPNDTLFLMLGPDSPDVVRYGAHDGGPMGARIENMGIDPNDCGMWGYQEGDKNHDCYVDFYDYVAIAKDWTECTHPDCD